MSAATSSASGMSGCASVALGGADLSSTKGAGAAAGNDALSSTGAASANSAAARGDSGASPARPFAAALAEAAQGDEGASAESRDSNAAANGRVLADSDLGATVRAVVLGANRAQGSAAKATAPGAAVSTGATSSCATGAGGGEAPSPLSTAAAAAAAAAEDDAASQTGAPLSALGGASDGTPAAAGGTPADSSALGTVLNGKAGKPRTASPDQGSSTPNELAMLSMLLTGAPALAEAAYAGTGAAADNVAHGNLDIAESPSGSGASTQGALMSEASADSTLAAAATAGLASVHESAAATTDAAANTAASAGGGGSADAAAALAQLISNLTDTAAATAPASGLARTLSVPVSDPNWAHALAAQVQWLANNQVQSATLRLSPEHLGPLEVRIDLAQSQINVSFTANHAETRAALAEAVPKLRELFASGGLNLGQASVQQEPRSGARPETPLPMTSAAQPEAESVEPIANTAVRILGLVDEYV